MDSEAQPTRPRSTFKLRRPVEKSWEGKDASPFPPVGDAVADLRLRDLEKDVGAQIGHCGISGLKLLASYNLMGGQKSTITIPGKPPHWTPPTEPPTLTPDTGSVYRDPNAAAFPSHPMEPLLVSVMDQQPDPVPVDVVACSVCIASLTAYIRGVHKRFRMLVELVGDTVHLIRRENSPRETISGLTGYGQAFPEAYTSWEPPVKGSSLHQRIVSYRLGHLNMLLRFRVDAYLDAKATQQPALKSDKQPVSQDDLPDQVKGLDVGRSPTPHPVDDDDEMQVQHAGDLIPQSQIADIKTRWFVARELHNHLALQLPFLWIRQIPTLILAYHKHGSFADVQVTSVADQVCAWEERNQPTVKKLVALLQSISRLARHHRHLDLELVVNEEGLLQLCARLPDAGVPFSPQVRRKWSRWLARGRRQPVADSSHSPPSPQERPSSCS